MTVWVPLLAGALLTITELVFSGRRMVWSMGAGLGGIFVAAIVLAVAQAHAGRSVLLTLAGTAAAVGALGLVRVLARR
jgi:FtsH-binding integral membrane protein